MAGVFRNTTRLRDISDDMNEYDYDEDGESHQDDVGGNDGGENDGGENDGGENDGFEDNSIEDDGGKRPWITRVGKKFACGRVHRSAINILQQKFDGDWDTFSKIPHSNLREMFNSFRTQWRWDLRDDEHIFHGFVNVLKGRYPDIMSEFRELSKGKAREDGHVIPQGETRFDITCNYPPDNVPLDRWQRLCKIWNTEKWLKRSKAGRNNRKNDLSRHTGGSMGFDEHRIRLDKQKGKMVGYELVFIDTHATKETKKRLRDGEINVNDLDELEFVTSRSKESFKEFHNELVKEYGPNNDQNSDRDELAVWERLHSNNRGQMFGIGSSDPRFVVTGSQSSCGSISYGDARQSQEVPHGSKIYSCKN
ncbi:hypothetical protein E3N88_21949 [Mikania micrantha]|uniref:Transposase, Ptta/En/Spm, plant n=1 Tax=Mikania micrantha TaxID=192012 RepID=A0A5N6NBL2_9ASTR|nr:hypothetical protein E3N88_21949 [Mikania micrantha]